MRRGIVLGKLRAVAVHSAFLAALGAFAYWSLGFLLRDDLYIFGDNPGQFYRLWYPLKDGLAGLLRATGWNPSWYAGYPELQFYPPGFVFVGMVINALSFGKLSPFLTYEVLRFSAYLLPALTAYSLFAWLRMGRITAFAAGLFTLLFPDVFGGIASVQIGMLGDRLALGLYPIAMVAGIWGLEKKRPFALACLLGAILAGVILLHPFQALAPMISLALYVAIRSLGFRSLVLLVLAAVMASGLIAFWLFPLVAHSEYATPVLRASSNELDYWLLAGRLPTFAIFAILGLTSAFRRPDSQRAALLSIGLTPVILLALILLAYAVLIDRFAFYTLDPIRFIATIFLCTAMLAGVGLADFARLVFARCLGLAGSLEAKGGQGSSSMIGPAALTLQGAPAISLTRIVSQPSQLLAFGSIAAVVYFLLQPLGAWREEALPKESAEPRFLADAVERYGFQKLWLGIQSEPPGRLLVVSSQLRLRRSGETLPTYLFTLLPYYTGRETIGGTFHHWSPVATLYWYGRTSVPVMRERTDLMDNQSLFGAKWVSMDEEALYSTARRFDVSTIVATEYDGLARAFLDKSSHFGATYNDGTVVLYRVNDYVPGLLDFDPRAVDAELVRYDRDGIDVRIRRSMDGASLGMKVAYYPLWTAHGAGQPVDLSADEFGLMRLRLPAGTDYLLTLHYEPKLAEQLGGALSLGTVLLITIGVMALPARKVLARYRRGSYDASRANPA